MKPKLLRVTTVPQSLWKLLEGQLKFMSDDYEVHVVSSPGEKLDIVGEREGVQIHEISMYRGISPIRDIIALIKMLQLIYKIKPDIVHSHTPKAGLVAMLAAKIMNVRYRLHTVAGIPAESAGGLKRWVLLKMEQLTYALASKVYPNSYGLYDFISINNLCSVNKLQVIGKGSSNGINLDFFKPDKKQFLEGNKIKNDLSILDGDICYLYIGRLVKDKGIIELVNAFVKLNNLIGNVKLILLGSYEMERDPLPKSTITEINENSNIFQLGYIGDIRPYLILSDIFVFPTYREGLPNVLLQASAYSMTILATDVTGNNDIIDHGYNGILVGKANVKDLEEQMMFLYLHPNERKKLAMNALNKIQESYEQQFVWSKIKKEYINLLNH